MTIIIDGIQLNPDCFQTPATPTPARPSRHRRHVPAPAAPAQCTGTFRFHVLEADRVTRVPQDIPFQQTGVNISISPNANPVANLQVSTYRLNEIIAQPDTQRLFTFARLLTEHRASHVSGMLQDASTPRERQDLQTLTASSGQAIYNFVMFGELNNPDNVQLEYFDTVLEQLYASGSSSRNNLPALLSAFVSCNHVSFGSTSPFVLRAQSILNMFYIFRGLQDGVMASLNSDMKLRVKGLMLQLTRHLYFNSPNFAQVSNILRSLATDLYRLPPQGNPPARINLYSILFDNLNGNIINPQTCDIDSATGVSLFTRTPFNISRSVYETRLRTLSQTLESARSSLNENLLRYAALPPLEALFESIYDPLASAAGRQAIVTRITTNTRLVRPAHLTSEWLAQNGNLREALEACLFDPAHPERGSLSFVTQQNGQPSLQLDVRRLLENVNNLIALQLNVPRLRGNVNNLLDANLTNRREFQATVLSLMFGLFGDRGQNTSIRAFVNGEIRPVELRINEAERGDLERFYAETIRDLGRRDALTETLVPVIQGVTCAVGGGLTVASGLTGEFNRNEFGPLAAGGGFAIGAGCAPLIDRAITGVPQNAYRRWGTVGGPTAVGLGVLMGFLPMIISAASGGDGDGQMMMMTPPMPMTRPINARNPTTGFGQ